jgi:hypothetical protein
MHLVTFKNRNSIIFFEFPGADWTVSTFLELVLTAPLLLGLTVDKIQESVVVALRERLSIVFLNVVITELILIVIEPFFIMFVLNEHLSRVSSGEVPS